MLGLGLEDRSPRGSIRRPLGAPGVPSGPTRRAIHVIVSSGGDSADGSLPVTARDETPGASLVSPPALPDRKDPAPPLPHSDLPGHRIVACSLRTSSPPLPLNTPSRFPSHPRPCPQALPPLGPPQTPEQRLPRRSPFDPFPGLRGQRWSLVLSLPRPTTRFLHLPTPPDLFSLPSPAGRPHSPRFLTPPLLDSHPPRVSALSPAPSAPPPAPDALVHASAPTPPANGDVGGGVSGGHTDVGPVIPSTYLPTPPTPRVPGPAEPPVDGGGVAWPAPPPARHLFSRRSARPVTRLAPPSYSPRLASGLRPRRGLSRGPVRRHRSRMVAKLGARMEALLMRGGAPLDTLGLPQPGTFDATNRVWKRWPLAPFDSVLPVLQQPLTFVRVPLFFFLSLCLVRGLSTPGSLFSIDSPRLSSLFSRCRESSPRLLSLHLSPPPLTSLNSRFHPLRPV